MIPVEQPACLLLGSNIQPEYYLPLAVRQLHGFFAVEGVSRVWQTPAIGSAGPPFLNAAVRVRTALGPEEMKGGVLRPLEAQLGRVRREDKNAPRTIDIDLVLWGEQVLEPRIWEWAHVAVPVAEVWPYPLAGPGGETLREAARRLRTEARIDYRRDVTLTGETD